MAVITTRQANGSFADQVFDEVVGSARKWFTLSGCTLDGTYHPVPASGGEQVGFISAYTTDASGNVWRPALSFDGVDDYVRISDAPSLDLTTQITIEARIKAASFKTGWQGIALKQSIGSYEMWVYGNQPQFGLKIDGVQYREIAARTLQPGVQYWLSYTFDGQNMKIYVDGNLEGVWSHPGAITPDDRPLLIGYSGYSTEYFNGEISEVRIWNYARSQAEIQRDMNKPLKGNEPGLIGYWTLDEGAGGVVYDKTSNGNNSTIYGATWAQVPGAAVVRWSLDSARPAHTLRVHGDTQRNIYPVDFDIQLYDTNANLLLTKQVRGNTQVQWSEALAQTYEFTTLDVVVYKMSAQSSIILTECSNEFRVVRADALSPALVGAKLTLGVGVYGQDVLAPKVIEVKNVLVSFTRYDVAAPTLVEAKNLTVSITRADTVAPAVAESKSVSASLVKVDTLLLKMVESKSVSVGIVKADAIAPTIVESKSVSVNFARADALLPSLTEAKSVTASFARTDVLLPGVAEVRNVTASFTKVDVLSPKVIESKLVEVRITKVDALSPKTVEAKSVTASLTKADAVSLGLTEAKGVTAGFTRADTLLLGLVEAKNITANLTGFDTILAAVAESRLTEVRLTRADTLLPKVVESSFFVLYEIWRGDTISPKVTEARAANVSFTRQDVLTPKVVESKAITVAFAKADSLYLNKNVETLSSVVCYLLSGAAALIAVGEGSALTNVHTKMDEPERRTYGRVVISYTDPFLDPDMTATASETGRYTDPKQTANGITQPKYKWFSLHDNVLDGSYHPLPADMSLTVGWWSVTLSDANGAFATPLVLAIDFGFPRPIWELRVVGDSLLNSYPVDFDINLYDASGTSIVYTEAVTGNNSPVWYKDISDVINVKKMELKIYKINKPYQPAKVLEFYTSVVEEYSSEQIGSIRLLEELTFPGVQVTLGSLSANEIDITIRNDNGRFTPGNTDSPLNGLLKANRRVQAWLGAEIIPGQIEWYPLGVFWTTYWKVPTGSLWAYVTARDRLELLRQNDFNTSTVYQNYSLYQLVELILQDAGLTAGEYVISTELQSIVIPYAWFDRMSHRDALARLAGTGIIQVYCDRDGKVRVEKTRPTDNVIYTFSNDTSIFSTDFPLAWSQLANYIEVTAAQWAPGDITELCNSTEVVDVPAGQTVEVTYAFSTAPVIEINPPIVQAGPDITVVGTTLYAWGAKVLFKNSGVSAEQVTGVQITGKPLVQKGNTVVVAKDDQSIKDLGKIKATIQHDFIQTKSYAQTLANELLQLCKTSRQDIVIAARGNIALKLGDRIAAPGYFQGVTTEYMVKRQEIEWAGYLEAAVEGQKIV